MTYATRNGLLFLLFLACLIGVELLVVHSSAFALRSGPAGAWLPVAVLFDLTVLPAVLFHRLITRPRNWPISRTVLLSVLMLRVALFILPGAAFPTGWPNLPVLLAGTEGAVVVVAALRIQSIVQTYRRVRPFGDAKMALRHSLTPVFGERLANFLLTEGQLVGYALLGWRLRSDVPAGARLLTTHRESGQITLVSALIGVGLIELVGVHVLLARWNPVVAGWTTGFSAYGLLFLVADGVATLKRPSYLTPNDLHLRFGIRWRVTIPRSHLKGVQPILDKPARATDLLNGTLLTAPNLLLTLHEPVRVEGPYGLTKTVSRITFFADERATLLQDLQAGCTPAS